MKLYKTSMIATLLLTSTACASSPPDYVIDPVASVNGGENYEADRAACIEIAQQEAPSNAAASGAKSGVVGAAFGAGFGSILSLIVGGDVGTAAAIGAVTGGAQGVAEGASEPARIRDEIVHNCLEGRGYSLLTEAR